MTQTPVQKLISATYVALEIADTLWQAELVRCFGKAAGDKRYTPEGKGPPQSDLRKAHDRREACRLAWEAAR